MIANLKPYPAMKDSGVAWIGSVPQHWELRRTKTLLSQRSEKGFPDEPLLAATQTKGVVRKDEYENRTVLALKDLQLLKLVRIGDFVISLRSFQGGIEFARHKGIISPAYTILYPVDRVHHAYLSHLFKSLPYIENLSLFVTGIRQGQNIDYEKLARSLVPLPPLSEQTGIVRLLDHVDQSIQRYIRPKQKLIALLKEQRQATIHQAVTGQINAQSGQPYAAYKQSGIEWLREVPQHWEERSLSTVASSIQTGPFGSQLHAGEYVHGGIPVINPSHMRSGTLVPDPAVSTSKEKAGELSRHYLSPGDVVMARRGEVGRCALVTEKEAGWICGTGSLRIRPIFGTLEPRYLLLFLSDGGVRDNLTLTSIGATMDNLNAAMVSRLQIPLPTIAEQMAIVNFVDNLKAQIDEAIDLSSREIILMREYWSTLVAKAVTGVIDVREVADVLPEVKPRDSNGGLDQAVDVYADSEIDELDGSAEVVGK